MDNIMVADALREEILDAIRKAQIDAREGGRLIERALWIDAIKKAAPESFKKILIQRDIVQEYTEYT